MTKIGSRPRSLIPYPSISSFDFRVLSENYPTDIETRFGSHSANMVCGVSGGQDSIFLLLWLKHLMREKTFAVSVAYCNHFWQQKNFYAEIQIIKLAYLIDLPTLILLPSHSLPSELAARTWRQNNFRQITHFLDIHCLLLGHTASDLIETALWHLFRGTGPQGISSLKQQTSLSIQQTENTIAGARTYQDQSLRKKFIYSFSDLNSFRHSNRCPSMNVAKTQVVARKHQPVPFGLPVICRVKYRAVSDASAISKAESQFRTQKHLLTESLPLVYRYNVLNRKLVNISRPILSLTRSEIAHTTYTGHVPVFIDETNFDLQFIRNKIRYILLPLVRLYTNQNADQHIERFLSINQIQQNCMEMDVENFFEILCRKPEQIFKIARKTFGEDITNMNPISSVQCLKILVERYSSKPISLFHITFLTQMVNR
jgi:tRNA(Ile)-lysidine synthase TilS/MesJ